MRFPSETTIVAHLSGATDAEGHAKPLKRLFEDAPANYPWADAWSAADGGLITMVFDNRKVGWLDLQEEKKDWPQSVWPLAEKTDYFALGIDWNNQRNRAGAQVHSSCSDQGTAEEVRQSMLAALDFWNEQSKTDNDFSPEVRQRIEQFVSGAKVELSDPDSPDPRVHTTGGFDLSAPELIDSIPFTEPVQARGKQ